MKEQTYGWYPSVQDIYRPKGRPSSYHLECLYKYENSMYYQAKAVPPAPELLVRGVSGASPPPTPQDLRRSKSVPIPKFTKSAKIHIPTPSECWAAHRKLQETQWGVANDTTDFSSRPPTEMCWPLPKEKQQEMLNQQRQMQTAPQNAWGLRSKTSPDLYGSSSGLEWPAAHHKNEERPDSARVTVEKKPRDKKSRPASSFVRSSQGNQRPTTAKPAVVPAPPSGKNTSSLKRPVRIQSATVRREKTPLPSRPVTAGAMRLVTPEESTVASYKPQVSFPTQEVDQPQTGVKVHHTTVYDVNALRSALGTPDEAVTSNLVTDDYDAMVEKYGWRAQIHGDPYGIKKPMQRRSYAVNCPEPALLPDPPNVHMESNEPFFYNTIPHKPMSFAVHKEWMSEVLMAKRLELQKRQGGIKYNYKNFAFVY